MDKEKEEIILKLKRQIQIADKIRFYSLFITFGFFALNYFIWTRGILPSVLLRYAAVGSAFLALLMVAVKFILITRYNSEIKK